MWLTRRVLGPGGLAIQPCTRAEGKSVSGSKKDKVMCTVCTSVFVFPLRHRPSSTLYLDWVCYLPISCQHRRYWTQCYNTDRGYCGMSLSIWWQALITPPLLSRLSTPLYDLSFRPLFINDFFDGSFFSPPCTSWKRDFSSLALAPFSLGVSNRGC